MNLQKFININWYLKQKPYTKHTDYDLFYLKICRNLFSLIDEVARYEDIDDLVEEDCRELAYIFTSYFEDRVNGIGFWESLVHLNKKQFGKRLPFFDNQYLLKEEDESEDILLADIHYLAYISYLQLLSKEDEKVFVFFQQSFLTELADKVFDYFSEIEEILTTDFYRHYLIPDDDFIDFKSKLDWFTTKGYLTRIEFSKKIDDHRRLLMDEKTEQSMLLPLMYAERDRLLFAAPSSFTAFFPIDIIAGAAICSEIKKTEIEQLKFRPYGIFYVQHETREHYHFIHTATREEFEVVKKSFNKAFDSKQIASWMATLASWNNEHYISGLCMPSPYKGEELYRENQKNQQGYQKHFAAYRKQIEKIATDFRNEAAKFFQSDLVVFENGHALQQRLNEFNQWYFDNITDKSKLTADTKPLMFDLPDNLLNRPRVALFIPPGDNLQFISKHEDLLNWLQISDPEKLSLRQTDNVLNMLIDESLGAEYWLYLKKNFPLPNLSFFLQCPLYNNADFEALLRIYRPDEFSPRKLPRFTISASEESSHEIAKEIFSQKSG